MSILKIILGPTAVGKTDYCIALAKQYGCPIISCDSRQIFREMSIGTAQPSVEQLREVRHYFIACKNPDEYYTAGLFEIDVLSLLKTLFEKHETVIMSGGSGLYADAVCRGLDDFPEANLEVRRELSEELEHSGIAFLRNKLRILDPESYATIDVANTQRVIRALEVTLSTGRKFSSFKTNSSKPRDFEIEKICLVRPREELYERINTRVDRMMESGLVDEVRRLERYRQMPALNTVGYKEIFEMFDGKIDEVEAVRLIKRNTRHYAKRQMSYWARDKEISYLTLK